MVWLVASAWLFATMTVPIRIHNSQDTPAVPAIRSAQISSVYNVLVRLRLRLRDCGGPLRGGSIRSKAALITPAPLFVASLNV